MDSSVDTAPVVIGGNQANVTLWPSGQQAEDGEYAKARFKAGDLEGDMSLILHGMVDFTDDVQALYEKLEGTAGFQSLDCELTVAITAARLGGIGVEVDVRLEGSADVELKYRFGIDQTYLPSLVRSLRASFA